MACKIVEGLDKSLNVDKNALTEHIKFTDAHTSKDVVAVLKWMNENIQLASQTGAKKFTDEDDMRRYTFKNFPESFFTARVSHKLQNKYHREQTPEERAAHNRKYSVHAPGGTVLHDMNQAIGEEIIAAIDEGRKPKFDSLLRQALQGVDGFIISETQFNGMVLNVDRIIREIYEQQNKINKENGTSEKPDILFEHVVADPIEDVAGTVDVLAVYSDRSAMIYDYKTMNIDSQYRRGNEIVNKNFLSAHKKNNYKIQMSHYKRILEKRLGIKRIRGTRIVPIWVEYAYDKKANVYTKDIKNLVTGMETDMLHDVMVTAESVGIAEIDDFLKSRYKRIRKLQELLKSDFENRDRYARRIQNIEDSIHEFIMKQDITQTISDTAGLLNTVYARLSDENNPVGIRELEAVIGEAKVLLDFLHNANAAFGVQKGNPLYDSIQKIVTEGPMAKQITDLGSVLGHLQYELKDRVLDEIEAATGQVLPHDSTILLHDDNNMLFKRTNEFTNPFIRTAKAKIDQAFEDIRQNTRAAVDKIASTEDAAYKFIKDSGMSHTDLINFFVNKKTDNLYSKLSSKFFEDELSARESKDVSFFTKYYNVREGYQAWYTERLAEITKDANDKYKTARADAIVQNWIETNDLALAPDGLPVHPKAWTRNKFYWTVKNERLFSDYMSEEYRKISTMQPLKEYFDTIVDLNNELREHVGVDYGTIPSNFLPNIKADVFEKLTRKGWGSLSSSVDEVIGLLDADDTMYGQSTEEGDKKVPLFFTNRFRDRDGNVLVGEKSYDFGRSMVLFANAAYKNKAMREIEATVLALRDVMNSSQVKFHEKDLKGNTITDFMGNMASKVAGGSSDVDKVFNAFIDSYIYGITTNPNSSLNFTVELGHKDFNSGKFLLGMKNYMSLKALGLGFIPGTAAYLAGRLQSNIEANKGILYNMKQWDQSKKYFGTKDTAEKAHAAVYHFGVYSGDVTEYESTREGTNAMGAFSGNEISRVNRYINAKMLMKPFSYGDEHIDSNIAISMMQNYGIDEKGNLKRLISLPKDSKSLWERFEFKDGKTTIEGLGTEGLKKINIAFRNAVREAQQIVKGSMTQEDINYAQTQLGWSLLMQFKTWMPGIMKERFGDVNYNNITKSPQVGRYRALMSEATTFEENVSLPFMLAKIVGRNLQIIAADIPRFFNLGKGYKINDKRARIAYLVAKEKNPHKVGEMTFDEFVEARQAGIRAAARETAIMILIFMSIQLMRSDFDDDDVPLYREYWAMHKFYQVLNRTYTEIASFSPINPGAILEFNKIARGLIPITGIISDASKAVINTGDEFQQLLFGPDPRDKSPWMYYSSKMIPGAYGMRKVVDLFKQDESAER